MPNGHDRDWVRFCMAVRGFRARHGAWPTRMRLDPSYIEEFRRSLLSPADFERLQAQIELIPESNASFVAEDERGRTRVAWHRGTARSVVSGYRTPDSDYRFSRPVDTGPTDYVPGGLRS